MGPVSVRGIYAITPDTEDTKAILSRTRKLLLAGVRLFQYRSKSGDKKLKFEQALRLSETIKSFGGIFIVNDSLELSIKVKADGVHLGKDDMSVEKARAIYPAPFLIGASCYNDIGLAHKAAYNGADYVAFGSFFLSSTKPLATKAYPSIIRECKNSLNIKVVAIGGIEANNVDRIMGYGADAVAMSSALFDNQDIETTVSKIRKYTS